MKFGNFEFLNFWICIFAFTHFEFVNFCFVLKLFLKIWVVEFLNFWCRKRRLRSLLDFYFFDLPISFATFTLFLYGGKNVRMRPEQAEPLLGKENWELRFHAVWPLLSFALLFWVSGDPVPCDFCHRYCCRQRARQSARPSARPSSRPSLGPSLGPSRRPSLRPGPSCRTQQVLLQRLVQRTSCRLGQSEQQESWTWTRRDGSLANTCKTW